MKNLFLFCMTAALCAPLCAAPVTSSAVNKPATASAVSRPATASSVVRPSTAGGVARPSTSSGVSRPTTATAVARPATSVTVQRPGERPMSYGPDVSAREAVSSPSAPSASSAAASSSGRTQKATAPAAAQNTSSTVGLGMNNAQAAAQRDAAARATQVQKAESAQVSTDDVLKNTKMPSNIQEALRKMGQNGAK